MTSILEDGQIYLPLALRSYHETVNEYIGVEEGVRPAGGRQYCLVAIALRRMRMVTSSSCITQTFPFRRVEKLKIDAQV